MNRIALYIRLSRMDDNLAILYQIILDIGLINEDVANAMSELLFIRKLTTKVPGIRRVVVYEDYREQPFVLPVEEGVAYVPVLTEEYRVFLENEDGRLYADESAYTLEELLHYEAFYNQLKSQASKKLPYIVHDFDRSRHNGLLQKENLEYVESFLDSEVISRGYRGSLYPELIRFLEANGRQDMIEKHLLYREPYDLLDSRLLTYMIEIEGTGNFYHYKKDGQFKLNRQ